MSIFSNNTAKGWRALLVFFVLSWGCIIGLFRGALWGTAVMIPMDIPPTLYEQYKWVDPNAGSIPRNHWLVDMFDYDLPRTYLAHSALRAGEFPWWEPYSHGGRPLITEAHTSLADPLRLLLFRTLPFLPAYHWTHAIQSFVTGLGMFLLLRAFGFSGFVTLFGALSFQFAGLQALFFYPEHIPGSLQWYPYLWLAMDRYFFARPLRAIALGGVCCGGALLSGNQQSHSYLLALLGCLALGYAWGHRGRILLAVGVAAAAFVVGVLIAAPILFPQVELFLLSSRSPGIWRSCLTGLYCLLGVFPWLGGTFRTIDPGKIIGANEGQFAAFLGTPLMLIAAVALLNIKRGGLWKIPQVRVATLLVITFYVVIGSTPVIRFLYYRSAGLGGLGVLVLFAYGFEMLQGPGHTRPAIHLTRMVRALGVAVVAVNLLVFLAYPRIEPRLEGAVLSNALETSANKAIQLREFQVRNLPNEVTFKNPEVLIAFAGSILLVVFARVSGPPQKWLGAAVFVASLLPLILFYNRFVPNHPVALWNRLLEGGPEQRRALELIGRDMRLAETGSQAQNYVFPGATACYYRAHVLWGYSSFELQNTGAQTREVNLQLAVGTNGAVAVGTLDTSPKRFVWAHPLPRTIEIIGETLNTIRLRFGDGPAGDLVRTDTYYPGWRVSLGEGVVQSRNPDGYWIFHVPGKPMEIELRYQPTLLGLWMAMSIVGLITVIALWTIGSRPAPILASENGSA